MKIKSIIMSLFLIGLMITTTGCDSSDFFKKFTEEKANMENEVINSNEDSLENQEENNNLTENKENKENKDDKDNTKNSTNSSNEIIGRLEISSLNIKNDILSSQIKYTESGLNKAGNTVIIIDDSNIANIKQDTEIYIRDNDQNKTIYTVYNIYSTTKTDESFYAKDTNQIELTLVLETNSSNNLIIQAKSK